MKKTILFFFIFFIPFVYKAQFEGAYNLYNSYSDYKQPGLDQRRILPDEVYNLIDGLKSNSSFQVKLLGHSLEGRPIYLIKYGSGPIPVLLWSQMHGDESTATRALFDIFNYLKSEEESNEVRVNISGKLTLYFIPMLNPDGANKYTRRNALDIDLNRDAERLQFPEAKILKTVRDSLKPVFAFNLHDQMRYYTAGNTFKSAALSFLAPAYNYEKSINTVRANTMKVIAGVSKTLEQFIPGHIGRYNDDFEPRAFGDNMVKWGTSSILIESGWWNGDVEKNYIRKLNFVAILSALNAIATESYKDYSLEEYNSIPENDKLLFDVLLRNAKIKFNNKDYIIDVAIKQHEKEAGNKEYYYNSSIEDIGDLSVFYGYTDIDCYGLNICEGKIYDAREYDFEDILNLNFEKLISQGYTTLLVNESEISDKYFHIPMNITVNRDYVNKFELGNNPDFYLKKNDEIVYVVINGFVYNVGTRLGIIENGVLTN